MGYSNHFGTVRSVLRGSCSISTKPFLLLFFSFFFFSSCVDCSSYFMFISRVYYISLLPLCVRFEKQVYHLCVTLFISAHCYRGELCQSARLVQLRLS